MRRAIGIMLLLWAGSFPLVAGAADWRMGSGAIGPVRVGMSVMEAVAFLRQIGSVRTKEVMEEGKAAVVYEVWSGEVHLLTLEPDGGRVWRIDIRARHLRDAKGVGVGTSWRELQRIYPRLTMHHGEAGACALGQAAPGLSFCFGPTMPSSNATIQRVLLVSP